MKHVKSLYILSDSCVNTFPIDKILCVKISNKQIDITLTDSIKKTFTLRLTELLTCVFELTNYSQFFFVNEGLLFNPLHTEIIKHGHANNLVYEITPKINTENIKFSLPAKDILPRLAKSKLIVQNITDPFIQL
jgi:hypothetical protein